MRLSVIVAAVLAFSGCLESHFGADDPQPSPSPEPEPELRQLFLKPDRALSSQSPESDQPVKEHVGPTHAAFATEDLEVHQSGSQPGYRIVRAVAQVYYSADETTASTFPAPGSVSTTRHFVLWLGAGDLYNALATVTGPPQIPAGTTLSQQVEFSLPAGGLIVAPGEHLRLLVAPLMANDGSNVHWLIDHSHTPSRIEFDAFPWNSTVPPAKETVSAHEITGNSGLFTGVLSGTGDALRLTLELPADATYARVDVRWKSTTGPKSDLDLVVYDDRAGILGNSTTPYQSEHLRLWGIDLPSRIVVEVTAYSGAKTTFDLAVSVA